MRIIGGQFRSRVLSSFKGEDIRPTADRVKESLFNILSPRLYGARVLDLFCGSGALGLESLSRGAREAVFNDNGTEVILRAGDIGATGYGQGHGLENRTDEPVEMIALIITE